MSTWWRQYVHDIIGSGGWTSSQKFWDDEDLRDKVPTSHLNYDYAYAQDNLNLSVSNNKINGHLVMGPDASAKIPLQIEIHDVQPLEHVVQDDKKGVVLSYSITLIRTVTYDPTVPYHQ